MPSRDIVRTFATPVQVRLVVPRYWISRTGTAKQRQTTVVFRLTRPALVEVTVQRLAPDCRVVGRFRIRGHKGLNSLRFRGRLGHRALPPGTYRLTFQPLRPHGAKTRRTRIVILGSPDAQLAAVARTWNACGAALTQDARDAITLGALSTGTPPPGPRVDHRTPLRRASAVLGAKFSKVFSVARKVPPYLYAVLALAIALLGLAILPREAVRNLRLQSVLTYHRRSIALAGALAFVTVLVGAYVAVW